MTPQTVKEFLGFDDEKSKLIADLCNRKTDLDDDAIMEKLDELLEGNGIEAIQDGSKTLATYVNMGDTYDATIVLEVDSQDFVLASWGGWFEEWEQTTNEDDDTLTCGWCSHRTPADYDEEKGESWGDTVCESCGNYVDGSEKPKKKKRKRV